MAIKVTYDMVKESFEKEGYILLSKEYINAKAKLNYVCSKGHKHSIVWNSWQQGQRCPFCAGNSNLTLKQVNKSFENVGYTLLTKKYINTKTKLEYVCSIGHKYHTNWNSWQQGHRCPYCGGSKIDIVKISQEFSIENYSIISNNLDCKGRIKYMCPKGHQHYITYSNWKQGKRCSFCSGNNKKTVEDISLIVEKEGYTLISKEYTNAHKKLTIKCPKNHIFKSSWHNWDSDKRCPVCPSQQSKFEKEIKLFISNLGVTYSTNDRTVLINPETNHSLELDLFFPQLNKAIECNGVYWHSRTDVYNRDKIKKKLCVNKDIDLLIITDEEWIVEKSNIKNKIKLFIDGEHNG